MASAELKTSLKTVLTVVLVTTVLLLVFSYFLITFLGPTLFFFTPEGLGISTLPERGLPIWLFTLVGFGVDVPNIGIFFSLLWGVFVVCLIAAWQFRENLHEAVMKSFSRPMKKLFDNCLFAMPVISSMVLMAVVAIQSLQEAGGVPTGQPSFPENYDPFRILFVLSWASVVEEVGFRIIPIGVFLIIYIFWAGKNAATLSPWRRLKLFLTAPLFPDKAKRMADLRTVSDSGVRGGISSGEWVMVFFTAIVFGSAHYLLGGGWEIGKVTSASVVGFAMALTYLLYGFQAPILLHWFFNHYSWFFTPDKEGGLQFVSRIYPNASLLFGLIELVMIVVGVLGWIALLVTGLRKMFRAVAKKA